jgi:BirA family biotin operon repressor/biotin-[acetyl-CoA-carboxylase] ligase
LIDEHKVAGILIETTGNAGKLIGAGGMGMNVNGSLAPWPEIAARATTLEDALHRSFSREAIIIAFVQSLGTIHMQLVADVGDMAKENLWARWRKRLVTLGRATTVHQGTHLITGIAEDVAPDGALVLRLDDGSRTLITWGDVESAGS